MGTILLKDTFTYDDILIVPQKSDVTRESCNAEDKNISWNSKLPLIPAPMDTVLDQSFSDLLVSKGVFHFMLWKDAKDFIEKGGLPWTDEMYRKICGVAIFSSMSDEDLEVAVKNFDYVLIDCSHGHSQFMCNLVAKIKMMRPNIHVTVGNVVTPEAVWDLFQHGARGFRIGIGAGSICTTRTVTGHGYPQGSAVNEIHNWAVGTGIRESITLIADGGINFHGDMAKAIALGADTVMCGKLFAQCWESGAIQMTKEAGYEHQVVYRGMGSSDANSERYGTSAKSSEGVSGMLEKIYTLDEFMSSVEGSLKSSMYYSGSPSIKELRDNSFIIINRSNSIASENFIRVRPIKAEANFRI